MDGTSLVTATQATDVTALFQTGFTTAIATILSLAGLLVLMYFGKWVMNFITGLFR